MKIDFSFRMKNYKFCTEIGEACYLQRLANEAVIFVCATYIKYLRSRTSELARDLPNWTASKMLISRRNNKTFIFHDLLYFFFIFVLLFQNFLAANAQCWWNGPLTAATRALKYAGHVAPGMLLVTAEPCALEVLRGAYARSVLKPPATYVISSVGKSLSFG